MNEVPFTAYFSFGIIIYRCTRCGFRSTYLPYIIDSLCYEVTSPARE
jgi:hypothetical protein